MLLLALGSVSLVWGLNWVVMKVALADMGAMQFATLRLWLAALVLFGVLLVLRRPFRVARPAAVALTGFFQTGLTTALTLWALGAGTASKNAVLCYTMPFWVLLIAWPILGERPSRRGWIAVVLAATGLVLMIAGGVAGTLVDLVAMGSGVAWALGIVLTKRLKVAHSGDVLAFSAWQTAVGGAFVGLLALAFPGAEVRWSATLLLALAYNALLVYGLMWFLWFWALQRLDTGIASLSMLAVPVVGVLAGVVFLGERPTAPEWIGMALTVAALLMTASMTARGGR